MQEQDLNNYINVYVTMKLKNGTILKGAIFKYQEWVICQTRPIPTAGWTDCRPFRPEDVESID
jgi:hypothetical protein